jgi:opacity protein-like surface antigen
MHIKKKFLWSSAFLAFTTIQCSPTSNNEVSTAPKASTTIPSFACKKPRDITTQFSGLSLGIHGGFSHLAAKSNYMYTNSFPQAFPGHSGIQTMSGGGSLIGVHAILGKLFLNNFYLGGEITADYHFVKGVVQDGVYFGKRVSYQQKDSYSTAIRMGILAGETVVYIKSGGAFTCTTIDSQYPRLGVPTYKSTKYKPGFLAGFGAIIPLNNKFSVGLEAEYIKYKSEKIIHTDASDYAINNNTFNLKLKISIKI